MTMLPHIAAQVLNTPLLIHAGKLAVIASFLDGRIGIDASELRDMPEASRFVGTAQDPDRRGGLPFMRTEDGVAIITVTGSLVNRGAWIGSYSGMTSYEGLNHQVSTAANDPRIRAILLDLESPGGQAVGAFEAADVVRAAAAKKPVTAVVNGMAASAAYAIASAATRIVTTPTGISGSIGVVVLHADHSEALAKAGIKPTLIFSGAKKVDGNPYETLTKGARADIQAESDRFYELFVQGVAKGRKNLTDKAIRATEAQIFIGKDAVSAGLADAVGTFESALAELARGAPGRSSPSRAPTGASMRTRTVDETEEKQVRADERARVKTIVTCEEAKDRGPQALMIAIETELGVDAARAILAASPKHTTASSLASRMEGRTELVLDPDSPPGAEREARRAETAKATNPGAIYGARRQQAAAAYDKDRTR